MYYYVNIGQLLLDEEIITKEQLEIALQKQKETGDRIAKIFVNLGFVEEEALLKLLEVHLKIPLVDLSKTSIHPEISKKLTEDSSKFFKAVLLSEKNGNYQVGMVDPQDIFAVDQIAKLLDKPIEPRLISEKNLHQALDMVYQHSSDIYRVAEKLSNELENAAIKAEDNNETDTVVSRFIKTLFDNATKMGASDIHIEPDVGTLRIRFRVDGLLHEQIIEGKYIASALTQRLKLMANLNITEKRLPQDGRFNIQVINDTMLDIRLSTMPMEYGESIVMRLLNPSSSLDINTIGMPENILTHFRKLLKRPQGIILVTGPTGSGKTTTLYSAINEINDVSKKFITIEDPVEYRLPRINQVQVNTKLDLTFARILRAALRQDPNIILVGEIRDQETASIALRAALTGHLVLATLHTNDAASSAIRLIDMKVESYLVAATVIAALAQRLVRRVCKNCSQVHQPTADEKMFFAEFFGENFSSQSFVEGVGCEQCKKTGYQGRVGVYELIEFDPEMKAALRVSDGNKFAELAYKNKRTHSLLANAYQLACQKITTLSEVLRVAGYME
jgi:MSHA biogenesis protein MshE